MRLSIPLIFTLLFGARAMALPLFPVLTNMPLAVTTNREVARGIAFDGTNFLAVFQGDNLYASAGTTNQLAGQFISSDGALLGGRIDLELNGSIPLVAFDGTNHLVVWMDPANSIPGVYGQFLNRDGTKIGGEFLIHSNAAIGEVGALVFAFGQHFVIWSATNAASNVALIAAQRVSPSGTLMGSVLALGAAQSDAQQFPTLAVGHTNLLVTWTARRSDTNLWNVMGRFVDASGSTSTEFVISQESAWAAYPSAAAFGGSNYLVAWSREAEPWSSFFIGYQNQQEVFTNRLFPTLFGRLVNSGGAMAQNEFQIVRARWGQFSPALAFDGTNFVLVWNDRRFSTDQQYYGTYLNRLRFRDDIVPAYTPFARFIGRDGTLVETEFIVHNTDSSFPAFASGSSVGPKCLVVGDSGFLLRNTIGLSGGVNDDVSFITLKRGLYLPPQFSVVGVTNNSLRLKMDSPNAYCVHAANDLKNWPTSTNLFPWWDPQQNSFAEGASVWPRFSPSERGFIDVPLTTGARFFRAVDGTDWCKSNLRKIMWAKEQWAIDFGHSIGAHASWTDLEGGPTNYVNPRPECPSGGYYSLNALSQLPTCNIAGYGRSREHRLP